MTVLQAAADEKLYPVDQWDVQRAAERPVVAYDYQMQPHGPEKQNVDLKRTMERGSYAYSLALQRLHTIKNPFFDGPSESFTTFLACAGKTQRPFCSSPTHISCVTSPHTRYHIGGATFLQQAYH